MGGRATARCCSSHRKTQDLRRAATAAITALLLSTLATPQALADAPNAVAVRISSTFAGAEELAAVSDGGALVQAEFDYARAVLPLWRGHLWAELSWATGTLGTQLFAGSLQSDAWFNAITVGARYTLPVLSWLVVQGRFAMGPSIASFDLSGTSTTGQHTFEQVSHTAVGLAGHVLAGLQFRWPRPWKRYAQGGGITGAFVIEGGLAFGTDLSVDMQPSHDDDLIHAQVEGTDLGSINPTGPAIRAGFTLQF